MNLARPWNYYVFMHVSANKLTKIMNALKVNLVS